MSVQTPHFAMLCEKPTERHIYLIGREILIKLQKNTQLFGTVYLLTKDVIRKYYVANRIIT